MEQAASGIMFGGPLGRFVGMRTAPATLQRPVRGNLFAATRLVAPPNTSGPLRFPKERAYVFSVQLADVNRRDLWVEGKRAEQSRLPEGSVSFYDLEADIDSQVHSGFDSLQFYVPRHSFDDHANQAGETLRGIDLQIGVPLRDDTIKHLAHCMLPTLQHPKAQDSMFVEEMALALHAHIAGAYGSGVDRRPLVRGGLAPWQQRRAREMLTDDFTTIVSLSEVATECGLSVGHFARAFRESTGDAPHRWLVKQRIDRAKIMLSDERRRLADIAVDCGFSDQSHFSRMFVRETGTPPGVWRRLRQN